MAAFRGLRRKEAFAVSTAGSLLYSVLSSHYKLTRAGAGLSHFYNSCILQRFTAALRSLLSLSQTSSVNIRRLLSHITSPRFCCPSKCFLCSDCTGISPHACTLAQARAQNPPAPSWQAVPLASQTETHHVHVPPSHPSCCRPYRTAEQQKINLKLKLSRAAKEKHQWGPLFLPWQGLPQALLHDRENPGILLSSPPLAFVEITSGRGVLPLPAKDPE